MYLQYLYILLFIFFLSYKVKVQIIQCYRTFKIVLYVSLFKCILTTYEQL